MKAAAEYQDKYIAQVRTHTDGVTGFVQVDLPGRHRAAVLPFQDQQDSQRAMAMAHAIMNSHKRGEFRT